MSNKPTVSHYSYEDYENALKNGDFFAVYQPLYDAHTLKPVSSEALARLKAPDGSIIMPGEFIQTFEESGLIETLDFYILKIVCQNLRLCIDKGLNPLPIAVNFSRSHLFDSAFINKIVSIINDYKINPSLIVIELTETLFVSDFKRGQQIIKSLSDIGFSVAMDDFGSGYSSLSVIKKVEFDAVKLDKDFLEITNNKDLKIVSGAIRILKKVGLLTIAEGIEEKAQLDLFREIGCDLIQGYYFSKPLLEKEYEFFLKSL